MEDMSLSPTFIFTQMTSRKIFAFVSLNVDLNLAVTHLVCEPQLGKVTSSNASLLRESYSFLRLVTLEERL